MNLKEYPRLIGLFFFAASAALCVWYYQSILEDAARHEQKYIAIPHAFACLVCFAFVFLWMAILGNKVAVYSKGLKERKKTIKDYLIFALLVLPGLLAEYFLEHALSQLGYN